MFRIYAYTVDHQVVQIIDRAANAFQDESYNARFVLKEIKDTIHHLNANKSCGADYVHNQFLIHLPETKIMQLLGIFNRIWRSGDIPTEWKLGLIIPILKPGKDPLLPGSYRPISLLSCLSKLMEKMVYDRLIYILETRNLLSPTQFGFRIRRCTERFSK